MTICCADLQELRYFQRIRLVAGEKGLYRQITWPFICTTSTISEWLHGGELLFVTGAGLSGSEENLLNLLKESVCKGLSGMVIVTGESCITAVPQSLIDYANENAFPLYNMPWDIKLIDVTQEISKQIINQTELLKQQQVFLEQVLFSGENSYDWEQLPEALGVHTHAVRFIAVAQVQAPAPALAKTDRIKNDIARTLRGCAAAETGVILTMEYINTVICLAMASTAKKAEQLDAAITEGFRTLAARHPASGLCLGFGRVCAKHESVRTSYREAKKALIFMEKGRQKHNILHYCELGLYRLLFEIKNTEEIRKYYLENLECLLNADEKNNSDLLGTLRCYLYNNGSLQHTANALFIHRNTLIYRLNSIRGLLGKNLDDAFVRHELFNSILAADFMSQLE